MGVGWVGILSEPLGSVSRVMSKSRQSIGSLNQQRLIENHPPTFEDAARSVKTYKLSKRVFVSRESRCQVYDLHQ